MKIFACNLRGFFTEDLDWLLKSLLPQAAFTSLSSIIKFQDFFCTDFVLFPLCQTWYSLKSCTTKWRCVSTHSPPEKESSGKQLDDSLKTIPTTFLNHRDLIFYNDLEPLNDIALPRVLLIIHENMYLLQERPQKGNVHLTNPQFICNWNQILAVQTKGNFWWIDCNPWISFREFPWQIWLEPQQWSRYFFILQSNM